MSYQVQCKIKYIIIDFESVNIQQTMLWFYAQDILLL